MYYSAICGWWRKSDDMSRRYGVFTPSYIYYYKFGHIFCCWFTDLLLLMIMNTNKLATRQVWPHSTCLTPPLFDFPYQARKVDGHIFMCNGHLFCIFLRLYMGIGTIPTAWNVFNFILLNDQFLQYFRETLRRRNSIFENYQPDL